MRISGYKCDACGQIFESADLPLGVEICLNSHHNYSSLNEPPIWRYEHVCGICRANLNNLLRDKGWVPTQEVAPPEPPMPVVPRRDAETEEPF